MNFVVELAIRVFFRVVAEIVLSYVMYIVLSLLFLIMSLFFLFLLRTGDFLMELATLEYFRDHSKVPVNKKPLHPVPEWAAALLGVGFWCEFGAAAYLSWPWLSSW